MKAKQVVGLGGGLIFGMLVMGIIVYNISGSLAALPPAPPAATGIPTATRVATVVADTPPVMTPEATAGAAATPVQIPLCTFAAQTPITPATSALEAYAFSEPEVVLTSTTAIRLFQWLPDGRRLLLTRILSNHLRIETLNVETGKLWMYAETSQSISSGPVWLPADQGVVFVESSSNAQDMLHIDRDMNQSISNLETDFTTLFFSVGADIRHLIFAEIAQSDSIKILRTAYGTQSSSLVEAYISLRIASDGEYQARLFSDGSKVALYNSKGFYLADMTGHICKVEHLVNGRKWGLMAKWSADGRYLAIITVAEFQLHMLDLEIFDTITGKQRTVDFGGGMVSSIDWHPSRNVLLVTAQNTPQDLAQNYLDGLYLVDVNESMARRILEDHQYVAIGHGGVLWSPSGRTIAMACHRNVSPNPAIREGRICLVKVEIQ